MIGLNIKFLHYLEFKNDEIKSDIGNVGVIRRISDMGREFEECIDD